MAGSNSVFLVDTDAAVACAVDANAMSALVVGVVGDDAVLSLVSTDEAEAEAVPVGGDGDDDDDKYDAILACQDGDDDVDDAIRRSLLPVGT